MYCPLLKAPCQGPDCGWFDYLQARCSIKSIAYAINIFLKEAGK